MPAGECWNVESPKAYITSDDSWCTISCERHTSEPHIIEQIGFALSRPSNIRFNNSSLSKMFVAEERDLTKCMGLVDELAHKSGRNTGKRWLVTRSLWFGPG
jgi:hypothetical protein